MQKLKAVQQMLQFKYIHFPGEFLVLLDAMKKSVSKTVFHFLVTSVF